MFVRVVRFTDVNPGRIEEILGSMDESEGPPEGVPASALQMLVDSDQGTAVVLQFFETTDDMRTAEEALNAMDPSETPGTRASVDRCELKLDLKAPAGAGA